MASARNEGVKSNSFGRVDGQEASLFTLDNSEIRVRITDYGGRLVSICRGDLARAKQSRTDLENDTLAT